MVDGLEGCSTLAAAREEVSIITDDAPLKAFFKMKTRHFAVLHVPTPVVM